MIYGNRVTRFEVIDQYGRRLVLYGVSGVRTELQDEGRTLKVFLTDDAKAIALRTLAAELKDGE